VARFRNAFDNVQRVHRGEKPLWMVPELAELMAGR
jgi:D-3-phosphoglycerate dehydrogenase